jgi:hypothetical protein
MAVKIAAVTVVAADLFAARNPLGGLIWFRT